MPFTRSVARDIDPVIFASVITITYWLLRRTALSDELLALILVGILSVSACLLEAPLSGKSTKPGEKAFYAKFLFRSGRRWFGCLLGLGGILLLWSILPEYAQTAYRPLFESMRLVLPVVPFVMAIVILYGEWRFGTVEDDVYQFSALIMGPRERINLPVLWNGVLSWLIKGFFLPLNFCDLSAHIGRLRAAEHVVHQASWPIVVYWISTAIYAALLAAIIPGYLFGSRLFGNHVRSVDQSWFGWIVTLSCYGPLSLGVSYWLNFHVPFAGRPAWQTPWVVQTGGAGSVAVLLGVLVISMDLLHFWGESIFGLRSSNLSNRGIITNGPYRFCKHPVYLVKCLQWFLIWLPPIAGGTIFKGLQLTIMWLGVCGIYMMRAWVEERLLSEDPVYVSYALHIDRHGLFQSLGRICPMLRFEWRLWYWKNPAPSSAQTIQPLVYSGETP